MQFFWIVAGAVIFASALAVVGYLFVGDRRYLSKKTSETFSPELREEIDEEREYGLERRNKFEAALEKAKGGIQKRH